MCTARDPLMRTTSPSATISGVTLAAASASGRVVTSSAASPAATAASAVAFDSAPTHTSRDTPHSAIAPPSCSWCLRLSGPSSSMSPEKNTFRRSGQRASRSSAARMLLGLALYASLTTTTPPASSTASRIGGATNVRSAAAESATDTPSSRAAAAAASANTAWCFPNTGISKPAEPVAVKYRPRSVWIT